MGRRTFWSAFFEGKSPGFSDGIKWIYICIHELFADGKEFMYCQINAGGLYGLKSYTAQVEVDVSKGLPCFDMVGLLDSEVREARERIRVALHHIGIGLSAEKITVNLSPAGIPKTGTAFDLPAALGILGAKEVIPPERINGIWAAGELGLDARIKPVAGVLAMVTAAVQSGISECILPMENLREGLLQEDIAVMGVETLEEAMIYMASDNEERCLQRKRARERLEKLPDTEKKENGPAPDFSMLKGMEEAKAAAMAAAAGMHNLLLSGPPGTGKTMLARCMPGILPPMTRQEQYEISSIYSAAGQLEGGRLLERRPFVSPHHTVSQYALAGGGSIPKPGMVTLAHRGILFLDELAEFKRQTLDVLRQPLEEGKIFLARSRGSFVYPADFMLLAATNPCPCGYYPDRNRCRCQEWEVARYLSRISGPLLDRFDLCCFVSPLPIRRLWEEEEKNVSDSSFMLEKVLEARERQAFRYEGTLIGVNGRLGARELMKYCPLGLKEQGFLESAAAQAGFSARGCHRVIRVARTLADLEGSGEIKVCHLSQAVYYRSRHILQK